MGFIDNSVYVLLPANIGGLLGLFLGFSIVSIAEIFYFCFIRFLPQRTEKTQVSICFHEFRINQFVNPDKTCVEIARGIYNGRRLGLQKSTREAFDSDFQFWACLFLLSSPDSSADKLIYLDWLIACCTGIARV